MASFKNRIFGLNNSVLFNHSVVNNHLAWNTGRYIPGTISNQYCNWGCAHSWINEVIEYINTEMLKNLTSNDVSTIRERLNSLKPWKIVDAYSLWYEKVKTGADWDHKKQIVDTFGNWSGDLYMFTLYQFDIWSNIHYGYIGRACGFSEWMLTSGAGVAQLKVSVDNVPDGYWDRRFSEIGDADVFAALDDPKDQEAIKLGFRLWSDFTEKGKKFNSSDVLNMIRVDRNKLSSKIDYNSFYQNCSSNIYA